MRAKNERKKRIVGSRSRARSSAAISLDQLLQTLFQTRFVLLCFGRNPADEKTGRSMHGCSVQPVADDRIPGYSSSKRDCESLQTKLRCGKLQRILLKRPKNNAQFTLKQKIMASRVLNLQQAFRILVDLYPASQYIL